MRTLAKNSRADGAGRDGVSGLHVANEPWNPPACDQGLSPNSEADSVRQKTFLSLIGFKPQ
jgi:hypothetical protein